MGSGCSCISAPNDVPFDHNVLSIKHFEIHRIVGKGGFGKVNAVIRKKSKPEAWFALKTLSKSVVLKKNCVNMVWNERNLLTIIKSPLIVRMQHTFQDIYNCYVVMDLLLGGDLKYHLQTTYKSGFKEQHAKFYVAGILLSLEYLHQQHILHRDVKPDNVILDNKGYPRLTDLGVSVLREDLRYCGSSGTTVYMAPELFYGSTEHGIAADFYSLGIVTYELLFGTRPWSGHVRSRLEKNPEIIVEFPEEMYHLYYTNDMLDGEDLNHQLSKKCRSFLRGLLHPVESARLGFNGAVEVKNHPWLKDFEWEGYMNQVLKAPFQPILDESKANCNTAVHDFDDVLEQSQRSSVRLKPEDQVHFHGFEYNVNVGAPIL